MLGLGLCAVLIALAGCDIVTALNGGEGLPCDNDQACPAGMACVASRCSLEDGWRDAAGTAGDRGSGHDGSVSDGTASPDAALADIGDVDASASDGAGTDTVDRDAAAPDAVFADGAAPDAGALDGAVGDIAAVDAALADLAIPLTDASTPDAAGTDAAQADAAQADAAQADAAEADAAQADAAMPDTAMPDTAMPDTAMPDTNIPDAALPDTSDAGLPILVQSVAVGSEHSCAVLADSTLKCWGNNDDGQVGLGALGAFGDATTEMGDALDPLPLGASVLAVAASYHHTCALLWDGSVKCWGENNAGQLGQGHTTSIGASAGDLANLDPVDLGYQALATAVAVGGQHSCALLNDEQIKCWGEGSRGQLGIGVATAIGDEAGEMGDLLPRVELGSGMTASAISLGDDHSCALLQDGRVKCWGANDYGQLGIGSTDAERGTLVEHMGDNLQHAELGGSYIATEVAAGGWHSCAIIDLAVKCWGHNNGGQLGLGDTTDRGRFISQMGTSLPWVALGTARAARAIDAGWMNTCVILEDASVKCWGNNFGGQLGRGDLIARGINAGEMGDSLLTIDLGSSRTVNHLAIDVYHVCVVLDDERLKCWGANAEGQLGLGDTWARGDSPGEMGDDLPYVNLGSR